MADSDRDPEHQDSTSPRSSPGDSEESPASAYAPPGRRAGLSRNPTMVAVVAIVVVALLVYVAFLVLG